MPSYPALLLGLFSALVLNAVLSLGGVVSAAAIQSANATLTIANASVSATARHPAAFTTSRVASKKAKPSVPAARAKLSKVSFAKFAAGSTSETACNSTPSFRIRLYNPAAPIRRGGIVQIFATKIEKSGFFFVIHDITGNKDSFNLDTTGHSHPSNAVYNVSLPNELDVTHSYALKMVYTAPLGYGYCATAFPLPLKFVDDDSSNPFKVKITSDTKVYLGDYIEFEMSQAIVFDSYLQDTGSRQIYMVYHYELDAPTKFSFRITETLDPTKTYRLIIIPQFKLQKSVRTAYSSPFTINPKFHPDISVSLSSVKGTYDARAEIDMTMTTKLEVDGQDIYIGMINTATFEELYVDGFYPEEDTTTLTISIPERADPTVTYRFNVEYYYYDSDGVYRTRVASSATFKVKENPFSIYDCSKYSIIAPAKVYTKDKIVITFPRPILLIEAFNLNYYKGNGLLEGPGFPYTPTYNEDSLITAMTLNPPVYTTLASGRYYIDVMTFDGCSLQTATFNITSKPF